MVGKVFFVLLISLLSSGCASASQILDYFPNWGLKLPIDNQEYHRVNKGVQLGELFLEDCQ